MKPEKKKTNVTRADDGRGRDSEDIRYVTTGIQYVVVSTLLYLQALGSLFHFALHDAVDARLQLSQALGSFRSCHLLRLERLRFTIEAIGHAATMAGQKIHTSTRYSAVKYKGKRDMLYHD